MANIINWTQLISAVSERTDGMFPKLLLKISQSIRSHQRTNKLFDLEIVDKNYQDIFTNFIMLYEQLLIEEDITDILTDIVSLTSTNDQSIAFPMIGIGKWIKIYSGNADKIFFFDEEKTMLSDKSLADFLNKIEEIRKDYRFFGLSPNVYYKFKTMPSTDVINFLQSFNIIPLLINQKTSSIDYPRYFGNKVLLDQSIIMTLCSNLSYGLSEKFYEDTGAKISKELIIKNRQDLEIYLADKEILVNQYTFEQSEYKINKMGGPLEQIKFTEWLNHIKIVPDEQNNRFFHLKDIDQNYVSVAEREQAVIVTGNHRLENKLDTHYPEMQCKIFYGTQLTGTKYDLNQV